MTVVDLDGTLISCNSFNLFARFLFNKALCRMQLVQLCRIAWFSLARKASLISHRRLKWQLMQAADKVLTPADYHNLAQQLMQCQNPQVAAYLDGKQWILASAASAEYVAPLAKMLNCKAYIATTRPESNRFDDYTECRGEEKLRRVRLLIGNQRIDTAISDHTDDLPLLKAARHAIVVSPDQTTRNHPEICRLNPEVWH